MSGRDRPLKIREAADALGVDYGTIRGAIEQGILAAEQVEGSYRIQPADLDAYRVRTAPRPTAETSREPGSNPLPSPELPEARAFTEMARRWVRRPSPPQPAVRRKVRPPED